MLNRMATLRRAIGNAKIVLPGGVIRQVFA